MRSKRTVTRYERALDKLDDVPSGRWRRWLKGARATDDGKVVVLNCCGEEQFGETPCDAFADFLLDVSEEMERIGEPREAFERGSHRHQRKGPQATLRSDRTLHRLRTEDELRTTLRSTTGLTREQFDHFWRTLHRDLTDSRASASKRRTAFRNKAGGLPLHPRGYQVFVTFAETPEGDPIEGLTAGRACDVLGLPRGHYRNGSVLWRLHYRLPARIGRHIPTVADAGWRPEFSPSPAGSPHGWTRDLGKRVPTRGRPEIVHAHPSMGAVRYTSAPEEIGEIER